MEIVRDLLALVFVCLLVFANYYLFKASKNLTEEGNRQKWKIFLLSKWFTSGDMFTGTGLRYREKAFLLFAIALADLLIWTLVLR